MQKVHLQTLQEGLISLFVQYLQRMKYMQPLSDEGWEGQDWDIYMLSLGYRNLLGLWQSIISY